MAHELTDRDRVYKLIDEERQYQGDMPQHQDKNQQTLTPIAAWIIYMKILLQKAEQKIYDMDEIEALSIIRKCTAVGVACMEYHPETPSRNNPYRQGKS